MSYYRNKLQEALLRSHTCNYNRFYAVCELVAYAAFLSGWLAAIVIHL